MTDFVHEEQPREDFGGEPETLRGGTTCIYMGTAALEGAFFASLTVDGHVYLDRPRRSWWSRLWCRLGWHRWECRAVITVLPPIYRDQCPECGRERYRRSRGCRPRRSR